MLKPEGNRSAPVLLKTASSPLMDLFTVFPKVSYEKYIKSLILYTAVAIIMPITCVKLLEHRYVEIKMGKV